MPSEGPPPPPITSLATPKKERPAWEIVLLVIAVIIGAWAGQNISQHAFASWQSHRFDQKLVEACAELNRKCPMMVDSETRAESTFIGPARTWHYHYTLVHWKKGQVDLAKFQEIMRPHILDAYRTNPDMADFRTYGVTLVYEYHDADGVHLLDITVGPNDLN
jgi:hypothetical protein